MGSYSAPISAVAAKLANVETSAGARHASSTINARDFVAADDCRTFPAPPLRSKLGNQVAIGR